MATTYCSHCGTPNVANAQFCSKCGASLAPAAAPAGAPFTSPSYSSGTWNPPPEDDLTYGGSYEKPTAAAVLSIIGGIFILLGGLAEIAIGSYASSAGYGALGGAAAGLGALGLLMGILILVLGILLLSNPGSHVTYGVLIIVFALISLVSFFGGFFIGFLLALIGGILALVFKG
ncbi:MAG TPA: zinc ribbon domain-containing protein [Thermoplasmata archaeon]|nr:zinc ribbon domain-containing protein [Thermoplasmata archaeon]